MMNTFKNMAKKIHIVGAGLSGMVAAINLAREGYEVLVIEAAKQLGGIKGIHPSVHVTPIDKNLYNYIGINLSPCIPGVKAGGYYIKLKNNSVSLSFPSEMFYLIERSARETSLDTFLYKEAIKYNVRFEFSNFVKNLNELPPGSIIATGLHPENFEKLGIPYVRVVGYAARGKYPSPDYDRYSVSWFGDYTIDYGYGGFVNDLSYILIFSTRGKENINLEKFKEHIYETERLKFDKWDYFEGCVPVSGFSNLKLFHNNMILAGTISGMMDPALLFGIHGALVSGKIAAIAVSDKLKALKEFKKINRYFRRTLLMRKFGETFLIKIRPLLLEQMARFPRLQFPLLLISGRGIPGYSKNWMLESLSLGLKEVKYGSNHNK